jgi:LDH2 family malate/lactate/ureidoglycolate dehydrogenase
MLERFKVPEKDRVYVPQEKVRAATEAVFRHAGVDAKGAKQCADVLITNDLRGVESHGISNQLRNYMRWYADGSLNPRPNVKVLRETDTTALIDSDGALGIHVAPDAMRMAIAKAKKHGTGTVAVIKAGHLGGAGYHASLAAQQNMIGQAMAGPGGNQTVPTFGAEPRFGTHPIAWSAPARNQPPFLFDVATTQVAGNKIALAKRVGATLEPGWITGLDGEPIMERVHPPEKYYQLPMGGTRENASHKGYGFMAMIDIMCNTMTGVGAGFLTGGGGQMFIATDIEAFIDLDTYFDWMDKFLEGLKNTKPAKGHDRVLYPGLSEWEETQARSKKGIPYHREVIEWFESYAAEVGVKVSLR